jgi:hypothetical protein
MCIRERERERERERDGGVSIEEWGGRGGRGGEGRWSCQQGMEGRKVVVA